MSKDTIKKIIIGCFISVPLISSIVSTFHLVDLFALGNPMWIAVTLAVAIELGSIASFLTLSILSKMKKTIVWSIFFVLFFMQVVGNVYFSYDWIGKKLAVNPNWINSFQDMAEWFFGELEILDVKMYLALLIGVVIPLISVFLLKSAVDYIGVNDNDEKEGDTDSGEEAEVLPEPTPAPTPDPDPIPDPEPDPTPTVILPPKVDVPQVDLFNEGKGSEASVKKRLHPSHQ